MNRPDTKSWIVFVPLSLITILFSIGELFGEAHNDDRWLAATFGPGMGVFGLAIAITAYRRGERWAWITFLTWPAFFAVHIALFDTWVPDGVFFLMAVGALAASAPRMLFHRADASIDAQAVPVRS